MKLVTLVLALILGGISVAHATNYYVDALAGSDSNAGTSLSLPWQTAQKVSNATFAAGDVVSFHCGQHFRPSGSTPTGNPFNGGFYYTLKAGAVGTWTGTSTNPLTFTSYGDCAVDNPAWIDQTICHGLNAGNCGGQAANTWTLVSGAIYKLSDTIEPMEVLIDGEVSQGFPRLLSATCKTGTCLSTPHGSVTPTPSGNLPAWVTGTAYTTGDAVANGAGQWYTAGSTATSGATNPTCTTGTCSDGTITWTFRGPSQGAVLAMQAGSWYFDGSFLYIWMPDGSNPGTHVIESAETYYGLWVNASSTEFNNITVDHLGFRGGCNPVRYTGGTGQSVGEVFKNSYVFQGGTANVDTGAFCNLLTWQPSTATNTPGPIIESNVFAYGTHGGITMNQNSDGANIRNNDCSHDGHACIDMPVGAGTGHLNDIIDSNTVHDISANLFAHTGTVLSSPGGIYCESCSGTQILSNRLWNETDPAGATSAGDNTAITLYGGSNNTVAGNIVDNSYGGFNEQNSGNTGLKITANVWRLSKDPSQNTYVYSFADTSPTPAIDSDYVTPGYGVTFISSWGGANKTLAQWQALGFDTNPITTTPPNIRDALWAIESSANSRSYGPLVTPNILGESVLSVSGLLGALTSTAGASLLETTTTFATAGHFTDIECTNDFITACTTAPAFNVRDVTSSTSGTALTCGTSAGSTSQAETLTFAAGDQVAITRTQNGGTCTAPFFGVVAHVTQP